MMYKHFNIAIIIRLILLVFLSMAVSYLIFTDHNYLGSLLPLGLLFIAIINIVQYLNKINQWIAFFSTWHRKRRYQPKSPFKKVATKQLMIFIPEINRLNELFKQTKIEISTQEQYFRTVINQSATGLFSINERGRIININPAAIKLSGFARPTAYQCIIGY